MCHVSFFIILWYHWCEKLFAYLHCIIWSEQGHIFYILSLLCSDDAVIRFDIVWKKKHLSIQAWVRVMLVSVCKYHPPVRSLSLFLTCDISLWLYGKIEKRKEKTFKKKKNETRKTLPLFGAFLWSLADVVTRLCAREDAMHLALRVEGIFLLQNVSLTQREEKGRATRAPLHFIRM